MRSRYYDDEDKQRAKKVDITGFLKTRHPDMIYEQRPGHYVYAKNHNIVFFKGRNGQWWSYDRSKAPKKGEKATETYYVDNMYFLQHWMGEYDFPDAIGALLDYERTGR